LWALGVTTGRFADQEPVRPADHPQAADGRPGRPVRRRGGVELVPEVRGQITTPHPAEFDDAVADVHAGDCGGGGSLPGKAEMNYKYVR